MLEMSLQKVAIIESVIIEELVEIRARSNRATACCTQSLASFFSQASKPSCWRPSMALLAVGPLSRDRIPIELGLQVQRCPETHLIAAHGIRVGLKRPPTSARLLKLMLTLSLICASTTVDSICSNKPLNDSTPWLAPNDVLQGSSLYLPALNAHSQSAA